MKDVFLLIIILLMVYILSNNNCNAEGYTGRNPLAEYLSLPDNVSEHTSLPKLPYYSMPDAPPIVDYTYHTNDASKPTEYVYNSNQSVGPSVDNNQTIVFTKGTSGLTSADYYPARYGTFAGAQSEGFTSNNGLGSINKINAVEVLGVRTSSVNPKTNSGKKIISDNLASLHFAKSPVWPTTAETNPLYWPLINSPVEPGWLN